MALTTAQQVRLKIQDAPTLADDTYYGDGMASSFQLPHRNITSASALVLDAQGQWSATGSTFSVSGVVTFADVISANTGFRTIYTHTVFSDDEIGYFTAVGGNVNGAAVEAIEALMFDSLKRARWIAPDGSQYDDTAAQRQLQAMWDRLHANAEDEALTGGSVTSWAMNQENA